MCTECIKHKQNNWSGHVHTFWLGLNCSPHIHIKTHHNASIIIYCIEVDSQNAVDLHDALNDWMMKPFYVILSIVHSHPQCSFQFILVGLLSIEKCLLLLWSWLCAVVCVDPVLFCFTFCWICETKRMRQIHTHTNLKPFAICCVVWCNVITLFVQYIVLTQDITFLSSLTCLWQFSRPKVFSRSLFNMCELLFFFSLAAVFSNASISLLASTNSFIINEIFRCCLTRLFVWRFSFFFLQFYTKIYTRIRWHINTRECFWIKRTR